MSSFADRDHGAEAQQTPGVQTGSTVVVVVSYRTPRDVADCLASLDRLTPGNDFTVHICENGGTPAWDGLCATLAEPGGPCDAAQTIPYDPAFRFDRIATFRLRQSGYTVFVGNAAENLGYAGGINAWLVPLLRVRPWTACWILNPDALAEPETLAALIAHANDRKLAMVGSRIVGSRGNGLVRSLGLRWHPARSTVEAVGRGLSSAVPIGETSDDQRLDAASGASVYIVRPCLERLLPFDERYFLYFEDLDWGLRSRRLGFRIGYANDSIVIHSGGRSLGSPTEHSIGSPLAVYLEFRNRLLFVKTHAPKWLPWTVVMSFVHAARLLPKGGFRTAMQGLFAGLRGDYGRPDAWVARHNLPRSDPAATVVARSERRDAST